MASKLLIYLISNTQAMPGGPPQKNPPVTGNGDAPMNPTPFSSTLKSKGKILAGLALIAFLAAPVFAFTVEKVMFQAIAEEDTDQLDKLLLEGANINGDSYLNQAVMQKNRDMVIYLLEKGADINAAHEGPQLSHEDTKDVGGKTPLCTLLTNFLSSKKEAGDIDADVDWVEFLLSQGADPNKLCYDKYTPLMMVSGKGADAEGVAQWNRMQTAMKIIILLVKNGADVNKRIDGVTAMGYAHESNNLDLVMFLRDLGATE